MLGRKESIINIVGRFTGVRLNKIMAGDSPFGSYSGHTLI